MSKLMAPIALTTIAPIDNEGRCDSPGCLVKELVAKVPKIKTPQFVVSPTVVQKPLIISGFNTVFQVSGSSAKFSDVRTKPNNEEPSTIYRIVANTHAHIVNYVVVDDQGDALRKINSGDPHIMTKLLQSQVQSAEKMLAKLMYEQQGTLVHVSNNISPMTSKEVASTNIIENSTTDVTANTTKTPNNASFHITNKTFPSPKQHMATLSVNTIKNTPTQIVKPAVNNKNDNTTAIITPISKTSNVAVGGTAGMATTIAEYKRANAAVNITKKFHINPQIKVTKITPILGTTISNTLTTATATTTTTPLIKTVPLAKLQNPKAQQYPPAGTTVQTRAKLPVRTTIQLKTTPTMTSHNNAKTTTNVAETTTSKSAEQPMIEKMQKELQELRRTVALLAESQAKTTTTTTDEPTLKRKRLE